MLRDEIIQAILRAELPCFVYDTEAMKQRVALASSLLERYFFPVKACPEPEVLEAALTTGCGLDLCSEGDVEIAASVGCPGNRWKFTSANAGDGVLRRLAEAGAMLDADSLEQALSWGARGGRVCGLRLTARLPKALYGWKFGIPAAEIFGAVRRLTDKGVLVQGLHLHDQHAHLTPTEFSTRLLETFGAVDAEVLRDCRYVNLGGSWPMRFSRPAPLEEIGTEMTRIREGLAALGFGGALYAEPGRWVAEPCGCWAARVASIKPHPQGKTRRVVILDTNTPVPCRPSLSPFVVLREGAILAADGDWTCDIFGSANTALDSIGADVRLPALVAGDIVVALGQGAYTRPLIPPFNERPRPRAVVV
jgi:diaminopimelate decarboxylase